MRKFTDWTTVKLEARFGLERQFELALLTTWLKEDEELSLFEQRSAAHLQRLLLENADAWNEQELSLHFIGGLFSLVDFTAFGKFNLFAARPLSAKIDGQEVWGCPMP